ncbi:cytochrome c oxidase subunit II [Reichenbachiella carrageenanivorans]|uniref:Cytochrome c oxidase subunit 2 n=1 Tax=Reichenbachiella carrageenanivorans TaxID=2979869 RepID=A0ABY6D1Y9_9BACT|nr:cytochrome c oxidase subunit II [Reichenbachiella carrageenanivorans]UXX79929.1 cytochrome c oxidase subunit II [Reichenbachiella carrageenanivorans]
MMNIVILLAVVLIVAILVTIFRAHTLVQVVRGKEGDPMGTSNKVNGALFMVFLVLGTVLFFVYSYTEFDRYTVPVASEHGEITFNLFWITTAITTAVFILTNAALFYFAWRYRYKKDQKAHFYPHNTTLELIWTFIPAIVLALLIFSGWKAWVKITEQAPENAEVIEVFGYQYAWAFRYPGPDGKLGPFDYKLIDEDNRLGVDFSNPNAKDDFIPRELHIPVNQPVLLKIRARDVIHSVYMPHFRLQMNAVPGLPTQFWFVPNKTTEEMRAETGNPDFQYELVCNKICGKAHFSMRGVVIVDSEEDYKKWKAEQKSWLSKNPDYLANIGVSSPVQMAAEENVSGEEVNTSL